MPADEDLAPEVVLVVELRRAWLSKAINVAQEVAHRQQGAPAQLRAVGDFLADLVGTLMALRRGEPFPAASPTPTDCAHRFEFGLTAQTVIGTGMDPIGYWAEVLVACQRCDEVFRWTGLRPGLSPVEPRVSIDHRTLLAPFRPASADPDFGQGVPGFDVNLIGPDLPHAMTAAAVRKQALVDAADLVRGRKTPTLSIAARRELEHAAAAIEHVADRGSAS